MRRSSAGSATPVPQQLHLTCLPHCPLPAATTLSCCLPPPCPPQLEHALRLSWFEGHSWTATVDLPLGAEAEFKFVVTDPRR